MDRGIDREIDKRDGLEGWSMKWMDWKECQVGQKDGRSLVATPDCKLAVPGSNLAISPTYSGLPILGLAAIWDGTPL